VICEQFRFKHFAPFGIPHATTQATTLQGYNIPKGAQVQGSIHTNSTCARRTAALATWHVACCGGGGVALATARL
jgi:hypothetical protein